MSELSISNSSYRRARCGVFLTYPYVSWCSLITYVLTVQTQFPMLYTMVGDHVNDLFAILVSDVFDDLFLY